MANILQTLEAEEKARLIAVREIPNFQPGDTLRVMVKIKEGERERVQAFEGVCIARDGGSVNETLPSARSRSAKASNANSPSCRRTSSRSK